MSRRESNTGSCAATATFNSDPRQAHPITKPTKNMIIYNVTVNIDDSVHEKWLQWMQGKHINDVLATGKFTSARLVKVLVEEDMGGQTYAVQYTTDSKDTLEKYYAEDAPRLREEGLRLFADKMLAFRTELEVMADYFSVE